MVGNNLKETQLQQIVDKTILFADKDGDGKISFEEFCDVVGNTDVHKKMVVDVWIIFQSNAIFSIILVRYKTSITISVTRLYSSQVSNISSICVLP